HGRHLSSLSDSGAGSQSVPGRVHARRARRLVDQALCPEGHGVRALVRPEPRLARGGFAKRSEPRVRAARDARAGGLAGHARRLCGALSRRVLLLGHVPAAVETVRRARRNRAVRNPARRVMAAAWARDVGISREAAEIYLGADVIDLHIDTFIWTRIFG